MTNTIALNCFVYVFLTNHKNSLIQLIKQIIHLIIVDENIHIPQKVSLTLWTKQCSFADISLRFFFCTEIYVTGGDNATRLRLTKLIPF